jgi:anti-anti-sigma factor
MNVLKSNNRKAHNRAVFIHETLADVDAVHVIGEIDASLKVDFDIAILSAARRNRHVVVNLTYCTYLDPCALRVLQRAATELNLRVVVATGSSIQQVLGVAKASEVLSISYEGAPLPLC